MNVKLAGYFALIAGVLVVSVVPLAYRIGNDISPLQLAFLISLVGTVCSFIVMIATGTQYNLRTIIHDKKQAGSLIAVGFLTYVVLSFIFAYSTHYVSASLTAVIYRTWPLMLIALSPFVLNEKVNKYDIIAIAIGFVGLAATMIAGTPISLPLYTLSFIVLLLLAAFSDALGAAIQKRYKYELYSTVFVYNLVSLIVFAVVNYYFGIPVFSGLNFTNISAALFLGVMQNVLATCFFVIALRTLRTSLASNTYMIVPFVTIVLSAVLLGEPIPYSYIFIASSVLLGLLIQKLAPRTANYVAKYPRVMHSEMPTLYDVTGAFVNTKNVKISSFINGDGRVLAFYKDSEHDYTKERWVDYLEHVNVNDDSCMILTDKTHRHAFSEDELEFVKEILGNVSSDIIVFGVGETKNVEEKLIKFYEHIAQPPAMDV